MGSAGAGAKPWFSGEGSDRVASGRAATAGCPAMIKNRTNDWKTLRRRVFMVCLLKEEDLEHLARLTGSIEHH
jgi:hypothetical protein